VVRAVVIDNIVRGEVYEPRFFWLLGGAACRYRCGRWRGLRRGGAHLQVEFDTVAPEHIELAKAGYPEPGRGGRTGRDSHRDSQPFRAGRGCFRSPVAGFLGFLIDPGGCRGMPMRSTK
jgi:hypothetical protein